MRVLQAPSSQAAAPFFCSKCKIQFSSDESLQKHFAESPPGSHMKCRTCGMAFEGLASWATVSTRTRTLLVWCRGLTWAPA